LYRIPQLWLQCHDSREQDAFFRIATRCRSFGSPYNPARAAICTYMRPKRSLAKDLRRREWSWSGNEEDLQGHPFVGPSGGVLDRALADAAIDRSLAYVTNVVKHFRFEERGKRRLHKKPTMAEIRACQPWFEAEIELLKPKVIVCLGATAAQALLGNKFRLMQQRGVPLKDRRAEYVVATVHPSAVLRTPDAADRQVAYLRFVEDLKVVRRLL
jgi:uracil-DNA glycosylase